jgi:hypothetical protein
MGQKYPQISYNISTVLPLLSSAHLLSSALGHFCLSMRAFRLCGEANYLLRSLLSPHESSWRWEPVRATSSFSSLPPLKLPFSLPHSSPHEIDLHIQFYILVIYVLKWDYKWYKIQVYWNTVFNAFALIFQLYMCHKSSKTQWL